MHEQTIAKLQALKAAPGMHMHWQEKIDDIIADLNVPAPPPPPMETVIEKVDAPKTEAPKSKVTTAAHVTPAKMKGKK